MLGRCPVDCVRRAMSRGVAGSLDMERLATARNTSNGGRSSSSGERISSTDGLDAPSVLSTLCLVMVVLARHVSRDSKMGSYRPSSASFDEPVGFDGLGWQDPDLPLGDPLCIDCLTLPADGQRCEMCEFKHQRRQGRGPNLGTLA